MARRRKQDEALIGLFIMIAIIAIIIVVASICVPIILAGGYVYYRVKRQKQFGRLNGSLSDFWLTNTERSTFTQLATTLLQSQQAIDAANERGAQAGLDRNLDGRFSARSNLGKEIRNIEEHNEAIITRYWGDYEYYRDLPKSRWLEFRETFARERAFLASLCAWAVSAILLVGGAFFLHSSGGTLSEDGTMMLYVTAVLCALISLGVFLAYRSHAGKAARRITPMPQEVTLDNVNSY